MNSGRRTQSFHCELCGKDFSRKDILLRHRRLIHGKASTSSDGRRISCQNCIRQKLKCSRSSPCESCFSRGVECSFRTSSASHDLGPTETPIHSLDLNEHQSPGFPAHTTSLNASPRVPVSSISPIRLALSSDGRDVAHPLTDLPLVSEHPPSEAQDMISSNDVQSNSPQRSSVDNDFGLFSLPPESLTQQDLYQYDSNSMNMQPNGALMAQFSDTRGDTHLDTNNLDWDALLSWGTDWLGFDVEATITHTTLAQPNSMWQSIESPTKATSPPSLPQRPTENSMVFLFPDRDVPAAPLQQSQPTHGEETRSPNRDRRASNCSSTGEPSLLASLSAILFKSRLPSEITSPQYAAAVLHLERLITVYFAEFHANLPVIHKPTWDIMKSPTHLIASMACLGSTSYYKEKGLDNVSSLLAEICLRHLNKSVRDNALHTHSRY